MSTMRITQNLKEIKSNQVLDVAVDVHKDTLNFFFSLAGRESKIGGEVYLFS